MSHANYCPIVKGKLESLLTQGLGFSKNSLKKERSLKKILQRDFFKQEVFLPLDLVNNELINPDYSGTPIDITFEDDKLLVLNKPPGIHGHPLAYNENNSVLNFIRSKGLVPNIGLSSKIKERGLLYRLDQVTSGVLIYIKDRKTHEQCRENFNQIAHSKQYLAIVSGSFQYSGKQTQFFSPTQVGGSHMVVSNDSGEQEGEMEVEKLLYNEKEDLSLVKINLKQGLDIKSEQAWPI